MASKKAEKPVVPTPKVEPEKPAPPKTSWDPKTNRVIHHKD